MRSRFMKSKVLIATISSLVLLGVNQAPAHASPAPSPALTPTFATPTRTTGGFTVQITNYDAAYTWGGTASPSGTVNINGTGLVTFAGPASATVTITTARDGYTSGLQTIGLCVGTAPITISTSSQGLVAGNVLTVTFNGVGKFCGASNFKMITAYSRSINGQGFLDSGASTENVALNSLPNRSGTQSQSVTYTRTMTSADEMRFFQFYFITTAGAVTKTTEAVAVIPGDYHEPINGSVSVSIFDGYQLPYYGSSLTGMESANSGTNYFGDLSYFYSWYNCGAPDSAEGIAALDDPTLADSVCQSINSGGYSYIRGELDQSRPVNITNSVIVSKVVVTDVFGTSSPFYSAALTTPTFAVTSISKDSVYVGGGETITVTGAGLTKSTIIWTPNEGGSTLLGVSTVSDNEIVFTVPAPTNRNATSATISIRPAGGAIAGPSAITLTRATVSALSNLALSSGTLTPSFSAGTTSYTASVSGGTTSLTVTPTFSGFAQTVTVNGSSVTSGAASGAISLSFGDNTITTVGTAEDNSTTSYTVTVNRPTPPTLATPTVTATATRGNSNSISLSWNAISNRSSYTVKIYAVSSGNLLRTLTGISDTSVAITTSNFTDLITRTGYKFSVTAIGDGNNYFSSSESALVTGAGGSVTISAASLVGGSAFEGRAITSATPIDLSDIPTGDGRTLTYQWFGGSNENSLTSVSTVSSSPSYTPKASDRSYTNQMYLAVRVVVTIGVNTYSYTSATVPVYTYPNATGGSVTSDTAGTYLSGKYKVAQTVYGHPWSVMGTPWPTLNYQWWICNTSVATATPVSSGCTASDSGTATSATKYDFSYVVPSAAAGKFLTFTATLSNAATTAQGAVFTLTQSRTMNSGLINSAPGITGKPNVPGSASVRSSLNASSVTYSGTPTGKISYQWQRCTSSGAGCTNITGATSLTYTPISDDFGKFLQVVATATSNAGETATATSDTPVQVNVGNQAPFSITNVTLTAKVGTSITVTATGGSGGGDVTYSTTSANCSIVAGTGVLTVSQAATCSVTATRAAVTGFNSITSAAKNFVFSNNNQAPLTITNVTLSALKNTTIAVAATGGSGTGALNFSVAGPGCFINPASGVLRANQATTCVVTAKRLASTGYNEVSSATKSFTFTN